MRKLIIIIVVLVSSCKTSKHKCDAYGQKKIFKDSVLVMK